MKQNIKMFCFLNKNLPPKFDLAKKINKKTSNGRGHGDGRSRSRSR
jgi:hypothetical protein